jgi:hypothetical protein
MSIGIPEHNVPRARGGRALTVLLRKAVAKWGASAALCVVACLSTVSCATNWVAYNPYNLESADLARLSDLCHSVMGFSPSASLDQALWPGNPDPGSFSNQYRSCVSALSKSLQNVALAQETTEAQQACRDKGYKEGSPELATCALNAVNVAAAAPPQARLVVAQVPATQSPATSAPIPKYIPGREAYVCAQIGLVPPGGEFAHCVRRLEAAVVSITMNRNYDDAAE